MLSPAHDPRLRGFDPALYTEIPADVSRLRRARRVLRTVLAAPSIRRGLDHGRLGAIDAHYPTTMYRAAGLDPSRRTRNRLQVGTRPRAAAQEAVSWWDRQPPTQLYESGWQRIEVD